MSAERQRLHLQLRLAGGLRQQHLARLQLHDQELGGQRHSLPTLHSRHLHHIIAMYHASGTQIIHDSLTIDGVTFPANITHDALFTGNGPELTNAFQVDLDGNSTPYHVYVDNMTVTLAD
jgi:hypothetical protein